MAIAIRQMSYAQAINEALRLEMRRDPRVILLGEDVAGGATIDHLQDDEAWGGVLRTETFMYLKLVKQTYNWGAR